MALVLCWVLGAIASPRISGKFKPVPDIFKEVTSIDNLLYKRCEGERNIERIRKGYVNCVLGDAHNTASFFILGDSHAMMWSTGLDLLGKEYGVQGIALAHSSCTPIFEYNHPTRIDCSEISSAALNYIIESPIRNVILAGYWSQAINFLSNKSSGNSQVFYEKLSQTLEKLIAADKNVYFVHDVPELTYKNIVLDELLKARNNPQKNIYVLMPTIKKLEQKKLFRNIEILKEKYQFNTINPVIKISDKVGDILIIEQGRPIYRDNNHLTDYGSLRFRELFLPVIQHIVTEKKATISNNKHSPSVSGHDIE